MESKRKNSYLAFIDVGLEFAVAIAIGVGIGFYVDNKLRSFPLFLVLGLILGATSGFLNIYRAVYPKQKKEDNKQKASDEK